MTKPREKTREELTAEIEDGKKKIRQFENREKMLRQKLSKEERRTRSHRLIVRGAIFESIVPEAKNMTDEEAAALLYGHNYMGDFQSAKQDFAVRSGLISKAQLFSPEELTELYRATDHLLDEGPELEDGQLKVLQTARTKIEYTVPDLPDRLGQGQEQEPQMDM